MAIQGEYSIAAPREVVWQALNDPEVLKACIPGCQELVMQSVSEIDAKITAQIGPIRSQFATRLALTDIDPPNGYTLTGEGKSLAGFGRGSARVHLDAEGAEATVLRYEAQMSVGGKLAQVGSRLVESATRGYAEQFFAAFARYLDPQASEAAGDAEPNKKWWRWRGRE